MEKIRACLLVFALSALLTSSFISFGQVTTATLVIVVQDQAGAVIPDTSVTILNEATGISRIFQSNEAGVVTASALQPGEYTITVEKSGFKKSVLSGVILTVNQRTRNVIVLEVGELTQSISVEGGVPLMNTENAEISAVVDERRIVELPLNGRNFMEFATVTTGITEGVNGNAKNAFYSGYKAYGPAVAGAPTQYNNYQLDGVNNGDEFWRSYNVSPSVDAVQEFRVQVGQFAYKERTAEFTRSALAAEQTTEVKLNGVRVHLGYPVQITAQLAWLETLGSIRPEWIDTPPARWSFIHPIPTIAKFPTGELMVTYSLVADTNTNPKYVSGLQISKDGGKTWGHRYDIIPEHQPMIFVPQTDGSLAAIPAHLYQNQPNDPHNFHAPYYRFEQGGRRVSIELDGVRVLDWPWPVEMFPSWIPRTNWIARLKFDGNALQIGSRLLATGYISKKGESVRNLLLSSEDGGHTWRYFSTIANPSDIPTSSQQLKESEGPSETALIQLADGDLMAVFRVGSGKGWNLRRAYSNDGGRSWTKAESIPPYSVEPSMLRLQNGIIALSTGRPGIRLWLSTDSRGKVWQDIDIVEYHNRWAPDPTYRISPQRDRPESWQTSSYTEIIEVSPNQLLLVYDRGAKPAPVNADDLTRIFVLPISVKRD